MKNTIIVLVILIIIGLGVYKLTHNHQDIPVVTDVPSLTYLCTEGTLKATYGQADVTLRLLDGRTVTLTQSISGSGIRYESSNMIFASKGNYGALTESGAETYSHCVLGTDTPNPDGALTFSDGSRQFSFTHSADMRVTGGSAAYDTTWRTNTDKLGQQLVLGTIDRSVQDRTNFAGATFSVGTSSDPDAVKLCMTPTNGEREKGDISIGGIVYKKITLTDAGAGNYYDTTSYRTVRDGQCYAIEYTIHSVNLRNYDPSQGIAEFDTPAIIAMLEQAAQSFTFLPE